MGITTTNPGSIADLLVCDARNKFAFRKFCLEELEMSPEIHLKDLHLYITNTLLNRWVTQGNTDKIEFEKFKETKKFNNITTVYDPNITDDDPINMLIKQNIYKGLKINDFIKGKLSIQKFKYTLYDPSNKNNLTLFTIRLGMFVHSKHGTILYCNPSNIVEFVNSSRATPTQVSTQEDLTSKIQNIVEKSMTSTETKLQSFLKNKFDNINVKMKNLQTQHQTAMHGNSSPPNKADEFIRYKVHLSKNNQLVDEIRSLFKKRSKHHWIDSCVKCIIHNPGGLNTYQLKLPRSQASKIRKHLYAKNYHLKSWNKKDIQGDVGKCMKKRITLDHSINDEMIGKLKDRIKIASRKYLTQNGQVDDVQVSPKSNSGRVITVIYSSNSDRSKVYGIDLFTIFGVLKSPQRNDALQWIKNMIGKGQIRWWKPYYLK